MEGNLNRRDAETQRVKIYVASSWRNPIQPAVVNALRRADHEVYDFRHPRHDNDGFKWTDIDPFWEAWTAERYRNMLHHPIANAGFELDWQAMRWADAGLLVMPCGRSAHLEAGYFVGAGKPLGILLCNGEPELMYKMATFLALSIEEAVEKMSSLRLCASALENKS